jgi:DNA-binding transcriptional LysR family regulator
MKNIDLNLLFVFEMLYEVRHVTKSAERLHLTQSAVSHSLGRLRIMLDDPLFIRVPSGLQPTERAHKLAPRIRAALKEMSSLISPQLFDPATSTRHFIMSASSGYFADVIARLIAMVRMRAPNISLQVTNSGSLLTRGLDEDQIDVALGAFAHVPSRFRTETLLRDELVWVSGKDHLMGTSARGDEVLLNRLRVGTASEFVVDRPHASIARDEIVRHAILPFNGEEVDFSSATVGKDVRIVVADAATMMSVVTTTDMIGLLPHRYVKTHSRFRHVKIVRRPRNKRETVEISLLWPKRTTEDVGLKWFRSLIHEATGSSKPMARA